MSEQDIDPSMISVVGAGTMGRGIASVFLANDYRVHVHDIDAQRLDHASSAIDSILTSLVEYGRLEQTAANEALDRVEFMTELPAAVKNADIVIEAVTEEMSVKREVFSRLDDHTDHETALASNTSGLSITEIASATSRPERVLGMHWFNPPYIVPLVEVIKAEQTNDALAEDIATFVEDAGKTAVIVEKDIPGYIGNRIQFAMCYEAFSLLDRGIASAEDIDKAVRAGFGFRLPAMGIFEKVDQSGLDVHHATESYLMETLDRGTVPNPVVARLVDNGHLGLKTGKGIYDWPNTDSTEVEAERDEELLELLEVFEE